MFQRRQAGLESRREVECDPLTGLLNRGAFQNHANGVLEGLAPDAPAAVYFLDVDHFKRVNDQYGHSAGDQVLIAIGARLGVTLGGTTLVCRWGGEEFFWIAQASTSEELEALALRVLGEIRKLTIAVDGGHSIQVTASIGWTRLVRGMTVQEMLHEADQALYDAKAKGRDRARSWQAVCADAAAAGADTELAHFQNVAKVVNERVTNLVTLFGTNLVAKARLAADQDRLTQLWNRGYFDRRIAREFEMSKRDGRPLTIAMMDLDHFGQFNQKHGLPTGDAVLRRFAFVAKSCVRVVDWLARYGGEEFALVVPDTLQDAALVAERIREAVEATEIDAPFGKTVRVTVSIGIAALEESDSGPVDLVQRVSDALQTAKRDGRNRVATYCGSSKTPNPDSTEWPRSSHSV